MCVYVIGLLDADSVICKIISMKSQFDSHHRPASLNQIQPVLIYTGIVFDYTGSY